MTRPTNLSYASLALLVAACGSDADPQPEPQPAPTAACGVTLADGAADSVASGGRVLLELSIGADVLELSAIASQGEAVLDGASLVVKAPYGSGGTSVSVTLPHQCDGEPVETVLELPVRTPTWSAMPSWTEGVDGPTNREYGNLWIDRDNPDRVLAFGGFHYKPQQFTAANELWAYDLVGGAWTQLSPIDAPLLPGGGMALVGDTEAYLFGGLVDGNTTPYALTHLDYAASPPVFTDITSSAGGEGNVAGDYQPSLLWDVPRNRLVAVCGVNTSWGPHCEVRIIDPTTGSAVLAETTGEGPVGRNGHFWVHDAETERLILFSGDRGAPDCDCHPDTWALELAEAPMRWVQLDAPGAPVGRRNGAYTLDPDGHRMFVWGGTPDGATSAPGLWALDLDRGQEAWYEVLPAGELPPERASGAMVYDQTRSRLVMGFGNSSAGLFADLWALSL
jgi:hypothetical protein